MTKLERTINEGEKLLKEIKLFYFLLECRKNRKNKGGKK